MHMSNAPPADDGTQHRVLGCVVVVVLVPPVQPPAPHASQQLATVPMHALPPGGAWHLSASCLTLQRLRPLASVRQQVTNPFRPQVERAAQRIT